MCIVRTEGGEGSDSDRAVAPFLYLIVIGRVKKVLRRPLEINLWKNIKWKKYSVARVHSGKKGLLYWVIKMYNQVYSEKLMIAV